MLSEETTTTCYQGGKGGRERERERETETERYRETDRERQTERDRPRETEVDRARDHNVVYALLFFVGLVPLCALLTFSSSIFRSRPGQAHTRTSKAPAPQHLTPGETQKGGGGGGGGGGC